MKITITGSLGNIGLPLTQQLIEKGHAVTVISHNAQKAKAIEQLGAIPAIGSIADAGFLAQAFTGADAVFTMIPPDATATDVQAYIKTTGDGYVTAIKKAGVKYVVNLSSIGAHDPAGAGPTGANYYVEEQLNALPGTHVLHLRPGMFYTNFFGSMELIRHQRIMGNNYDASVNMVLTHPKDIADAAAEAIDSRWFSGKNFLYVVSDEKNGAAVAHMLGEALGEPGLAWVPFSDEQLLQGLLQSGFTEPMAMVYVVQVGQALRNGALFAHYRQHASQTYGKIPFAHFAIDFAAVYNNGGN